MCNHFVAMPIFTMLILVMATPATLATDEARSSILLDIGQNTPDAAYMKLHLDEMERRPFGGVCFWMNYPYDGKGWMGQSSREYDRMPSWAVFSRTALTWEMVEPFVADLKSISFRQLKNNFIFVTCFPSEGQFDWFDESSNDRIIGNIRLIARAARESGCRGIVLDPEMYGVPLWTWQFAAGGQPPSDESWQRCQARLREQGRRFGQAISDEFPGAMIWLLSGWSYLPIHVKDCHERGIEITLRDIPYALYGPWLDGLYEGTDAKTITIDGGNDSNWRSSYSFVNAEQFIERRREILEEPLPFTKVPELYKLKTRVGFGIWVDNAMEGFEWHPRKLHRNYYTPQRLQRTIYLALRYSDGYVWTWSERANWWVDGVEGRPYPPAELREQAFGLDPAYHHALADARIWPGLDAEAPSRIFVSPATLGYIQGDELDSVLKRTKVAFDLPVDDWSFTIDNEDKGVVERWFEPQHTAADWQKIAIDQVWQKQGFEGRKYIGWYRREIAFPETVGSGRTYLSFESVVNRMALWIDGQYVGAYDRGRDGSAKPFAIEVTDKLRGGGRHTVVMRAGPGGIEKGVSLRVEH